MLLNEYDKELIKVCSRDYTFCVWCGKPKAHSHHIVYRSHGNKDVTVSLCAWCHNLAHAHRLHFKSSTVYKHGEVPVFRLFGMVTYEPVNFDRILSMPGKWIDVDERIKRLSFFWEEC